MRAIATISDDRPAVRQGDSNALEQLVNDTTAEVRCSGAVCGNIHWASASVQRAGSFTPGEIVGTPGNAGGSIGADSEPGKGTVFEVQLPTVDGEPHVAAAPPVRSPGDHAGTETILVVEDEPGVRSLVDRMLSRLGYRVLSARDAQEAFAILHSDGPIDLVLCDVVMPDLAGPEVVSRIQARSPRTRALFMSGHTTHALVKDGTLQEGHAFIQKPFLPSALARKVREVLNG